MNAQRRSTSNGGLRTRKVRACGQGNGSRVTCWTVIPGREASSLSVGPRQSGLGDGRNSRRLSSWIRTWWVPARQFSGAIRGVGLTLIEVVSERKGTRYFASRASVNVLIDPRVGLLPRTNGVCVANRTGDLVIADLVMYAKQLRCGQHRFGTPGSPRRECLSLPSAEDPA